MKLHARSFIWSAAVLATAVGMTACSDSSSESVGPDPELVEIQLNGNVSGSLVAETAALSESRAIIDATHTQAVPLSFARLDMNRSDGSYPANGYASVTSALSASLAASSDGSASAITFTPTEYYLVGKTHNSSKLVGWHPAGTYSAGVITVPINGENDIMLSDEKEGSKTSPFASFTFSHKLTQVNIYAYAVSNDAQNVWGKIKTITLKNQKPTCKIELPATVTFEGTPADLALARKKAADDSALATELELGVATVNASDGSITATNAVECGYAMIEPIASGTQLSLEIEMADGRKEPLTIDWANGYEESKSYTVTLKFTATKIEPQATISKWTPHTWGTNPGDFNGEVEL